MRRFLALFSRTGTADVANGRLRATVEGDRAAASISHVQLMEQLRAELIAVIDRHMPLGRDNGKRPA